MRSLVVALWCAAAPVHAGAIDAVEEHAFTVVDQQVGDVLREFAGAIGRSVNMEEGVEGRLTNFRGRYSARGFLDEVTTRFGLVWYDDGAAIHISKAETMKSVVIDFDRVTPSDLNAALDEMGIADDRFGVRQTTAGIGVVTGPARYVEMVENTFLMLANRKAAGPTGRPAQEVHNMMVVRGNSVSVWRGLVDQAEVESADVLPETEELEAAGRLEE